MGDWAAAARVAKVTGYTTRGIRARAKREGWRSRRARGNGGLHTEYLVASLPEEIREKLDTPSPQEAGGAEQGSAGAPDDVAATDAPPARWTSLEEVPARYRRTAERRASLLIMWQERADRLGKRLEEAW